MFNKPSQPLRYRALIAVLLTLALASSDTLHLNLDVREGIENGWLDPTTEIVGVRGDFAPLFVESNNSRAADPDGDGVYSVSIPLDFAQDSIVVAFKIKIDGSDNPNDGWQSGPNRSAVIQ